MMNETDRTRDHSDDDDASPLLLGVVVTAISTGLLALGGRTLLRFSVDSLDGGMGRPWMMAVSCSPLSVSCCSRLVAIASSLSRFETMSERASTCAWCTMVRTSSSMRDLVWSDRYAPSAVSLAS